MWISRHMWFDLCYEVGAMRERLNNIENYLGLSQSDKSRNQKTETELLLVVSGLLKKATEILEEATHQEKNQ